MRIPAAVVAFALSGSAVLAGGLADPVMEAPVVAEETAGSSGGILVPLLILLLVAAAIASSSGSQAEQTPG